MMNVKNTTLSLSSSHHQCTRGCGHTLLHILYRQSQQERSSRQSECCCTYFLQQMKHIHPHMVVEQCCFLLVFILHVHNSLEMEAQPEHKQEKPVIHFLLLSSSINAYVVCYYKLNWCQWNIFAAFISVKFQKHSVPEIIKSENKVSNPINQNSDHIKTINFIDEYTHNMTS